jgi:hypothetical protein
MKLNDKRQCPECLVGPLKYKRIQQYYCHRCDRAFDLTTGEFKPNWKWTGPHTRVAHSKNCKCGECPTNIAVPTNS